MADCFQEAIKDTTPASVTAEDDAELVEAQEEGGITQAAATAKHKTKSHFLGVFQKAGKKMAGFHGDVAVDGAKKQVCEEVCNQCKADNELHRVDWDKNRQAVLSRSYQGRWKS